MMMTRKQCWNRPTTHTVDAPAERELCIDNLPVRIHFIIVSIRWTGLAPWEFEFPFPGSLASTFPYVTSHPESNPQNPKAVLGPPYDSYGGRRCTYYEIDSKPEGTPLNFRTTA